MSDVVQVSIQGVEATKTSIRLTVNEIRRRTGFEVVFAGRRIRRAAGRRAILAAYTNIQDDESGTRRLLSGRRQIYTMNQGALAVAIRANEFWTNAKSRAIVNLYRRHGITDQLRRTHLWINPRRGGRVRGLASRPRNSQHMTRAGLRRFALEGRLLEWAMGRTRVGEVGDQHFRAIVRPPPRILYDLVLEPSLREAEDTYVRRVATAVELAIRRGVS